MENEEKQKQRLDKNEEIKETGTLNLNGNGHKANIQLLTIIGEIEGHEAVSGNTKATKYEHLIPRLAEVEDDDEVDGVLILLNTLGGDVEAGLGDRGNDRILKQTNGLSGSGRKPLHRRTACSFRRLFFYCAEWNNDRASGEILRDVYWSDSELS